MCERWTINIQFTLKAFEAVMSSSTILSFLHNLHCCPQNYTLYANIDMTFIFLFSITINSFPNKPHFPLNPTCLHTPTNFCIKWKIVLSCANLHPPSWTAPKVKEMHKEKFSAIATIQGRGVWRHSCSYYCTISILIKYCSFFIHIYEQLWWLSKQKVIQLYEAVLQK